jgi:hypothetical protein
MPDLRRYGMGACIHSMTNLEWCPASALDLIFKQVEENAMGYVRKNYGVMR